MDLSGKAKGTVTQHEHTGENKGPTRRKRMPYVRQSCSECKRVKKRCDGQNPCGRCQYKNIPCSYDPNVERLKTPRQKTRSDSDDRPNSTGTGSTRTSSDNDTRSERKYPRESRVNIPDRDLALSAQVDIYIDIFEEHVAPYVGLFHGPLSRIWREYRMDLHNLSRSKHSPSGVIACLQAFTGIAANLMGHTGIATDLLTSAMNDAIEVSHMPSPATVLALVLVAFHISSSNAEITNNLFSLATHNANQMSPAEAEKGILLAALGSIPIIFDSTLTAAAKVSRVEHLKHDVWNIVHVIESGKVEFLEKATLMMWESQLEMAALPVWYQILDVTNHRAVLGIENRVRTSMEKDFRAWESNTGSSVPSIIPNLSTCKRPDVSTIPAFDLHRERVACLEMKAYLERSYHSYLEVLKLNHANAFSPKLERLFVYRVCHLMCSHIAELPNEAEADAKVLIQLLTDTFGSGQQLKIRGMQPLLAAYIVEYSYQVGDEGLLLALRQFLEREKSSVYFPDLRRQHLCIIISDLVAEISGNVVVPFPVTIHERSHFDEEILINETLGTISPYHISLQTGLA